MEKALEVKSDIIAFTGLLTNSYDVLQETIQEIKNLGDKAILKTPTIIGGGTDNDVICAVVGADYWATDAMVGVQLCKQVTDEIN